MTRKITKSNQSEQRSDRGGKRSDRGGAYGGAPALHPYGDGKLSILITVKSRYHMGLVVGKPVFGVSEQVRHKPSCTATQDG